jgi:PAS domain S-box-containing protein
MPWLNVIQEKKEAVIISPLEAQKIWTRKVGGDWIKSHLSIPLVIQNELMGLLVVDSATPNRFTQLEVGRLTPLINQTALALKNARLYDRAREEIARRVRALKSERNFVSAVLDTAGALVMVVNLQGHILRFNRACEETTGYILEEVQGIPFWDLFLLPDEVSQVKSIFAALPTTKQTENYQSYWLTKAQRRRLISWTNTVLQDNEGKVEYIICTGIDITEPQQLEDRLVAIHQLGRELNLLRDEEAIWEIALETAAFLLEFKSAGYGVVNEVADQLEYLYQPIRGVPTTVRLHLPIETESRIKVLRTHSERTINTFETVQSMPLRPGEVPQHDWLSAPMKVRERLLGMLDIEGRGSYQFTANDQRLLQTLADQTAVAIENARLHHEARQRVDELTTMNMISQAITSTLNLEETLTIITDHSIRLLEATAASVVLRDVAQDDLWFHAASGGSSDFVRGKRLPSGQGIVGWVIDNSEAALVQDVTKDPRFYNKFD